MNKEKHAFLRRLEEKRISGAILRTVRAAWKLLANNFGLKMLSLLIAILLWNFVISTNTSITRTKTISGLDGYISGQAIMNSTYGLALLSDPTELLSDVSVMIEVSQSEYSKVSEDNVQVTLDLSSVRRRGEQQVGLKATTSYGRVVQIIPDSIPLSVESIDSRNIPVNVKTVGRPESDRWYNVKAKNPSTLSITGASSVVQNIASANVYVDVTGVRDKQVVAERYVLVDADGNEIPQFMLDRTATSVSVTLDVYPSKEIPIASDPEDVIIGAPAEGYVVESITIQPDKVTVVGDQEDLLDNISELHIDPISVDGLTQSFTVSADVSKLSGFRSVSSEEVFVNVTIVEETVSAWVEDVRISFVNKPDGVRLSAQDESARVYITGPRSAVNALRESGFVATVDLQGLAAGTHTKEMTFPVQNYPDVEFTPENAEVRFHLIEDAVSAEG